MLIAENALNVVNMKTPVTLAHPTRGLRHVRLDIAAITSDPSYSTAALELNIGALLQGKIFYDDDELIEDTETEGWSIVAAECVSIPVPSSVLARIEYSKDNGRRCVACAIAEYAANHLNENMVACAITAQIDTRGLEITDATQSIGELEGTNHAYLTDVRGYGISKTRVTYTRAFMSAQMPRSLDNDRDHPSRDIFAFEFGEDTPEWCEDVVRKSFDVDFYASDDGELRIVPRGTRALPLSPLGTTTSVNAHFIRALAPDIYLKEARSLVVTSATGGGTLLLL